MSTAASKSIQDIVIEAKPWITVMLLLCCLWSFYESYGHSLLWVKNHAFSGGKFIYQLHHGAYAKTFEMMFWSTFVQASIWQLVGNAYFIWVFGSTLETRLGSWRFATLVLVSIFAGWYLLGMSIGAGSESVFIGPGLMTTGIIGGYLIFFPEKKINPRGLLNYSYRIFNDEPTPNPADSFGISPWFIIIAFFVYQVVMHFVLNHMPVHFDVLRPLPAIGIFLLGLLVSYLLVTLSTSSIEGNPLKRLAIQRYRQLRSLDMSHDDAIRGSARILAVSPEQVKQWVAKSGGVLLTRPTSHDS